MSYIRAQRRLLGARAVLFLLLLVAVATVSTAASAAYASNGLPGIESDTSLPPQEEDENGEGDSELPWLFAVFFITWAAFFGYMFVMSLRQREMRREIDALRMVLRERERQEIEATSSSEADDG